MSLIIQWTTMQCDLRRLERGNRRLRERLERCERELQLSLQCLSLEQQTCKEVERALVLCNAEIATTRAREAQCRAALLEERERSRELQHLSRETLRAELQEQAILQRRLSAAKERIRELEEMMQHPRQVVSVGATVRANRLWIDGWAACASLS